VVNIELSIESGAMWAKSSGLILIPGPRATQRRNAANSPGAYRELTREQRRVIRPVAKPVAKPVALVRGTITVPRERPSISIGSLSRTRARARASRREFAVPRLDPRRGHASARSILDTQTINPPREPAP